MEESGNTGDGSKSGRRGIIFDLDGTLIDTLGDIADSMNAVLARYGLPVHDRGAYRGMVGSGMDVLVRRALPPEVRDGRDVSVIVQEMTGEYGRRWASTSRPYPGIPEMLTAASEIGLILAVLSNKPDLFTRLMVKTLLPGWHFTEVRGLLPGTLRKPDPEGALEIAGGMDLSPGEIVFVGDSDIDMETAARAGMYPVGVLWGYQDRERLVDRGADAVVSSPMELLSLL